MSTVMDTRVHWICAISVAGEHTATILAVLAITTMSEWFV